MCQQQQQQQNVDLNFTLCPFDNWKFKFALFTQSNMDIICTIAIGSSFFSILLLIFFYCLWLFDCFVVVFKCEEKY